MHYKDFVNRININVHNAIHFEDHAQTGNTTKNLCRYWETVNNRKNTEQNTDLRICKYVIDRYMQ